MRVRKLTADGDYSFGNSQLDFWHDVPEAVGQVVQTSLLLWLGEWFLDINQGTPYLQGILGKYSQETADTVIRDRILEAQGCTGISEYESDKNPETRELSVRASIDTLYGPTTVDVVNYGIY